MINKISAAHQYLRPLSYTYRKLPKSVYGKGFISISSHAALQFCLKGTGKAFLVLFHLQKSHLFQRPKLIFWM